MGKKEGFMSIGQRHQVQIEPYTNAKGSAGQNIETAGTPIGVWAEVQNPSGFRAYQNGQTQLGSTKDFFIRYRFDKFPDADWRLIYDGKRWTVTEIRKQEEKRFYYRLTATAKSDV